MDEDSSASERSRRLVEGLEAQDRSPLLVACRRIESLDDDGVGLAAPLVSLLQHATDRVLLMLQGGGMCLSESDEIQWLKRLLELHLYLSSVDSSLDEELGRQGSHIQLAKLLRVDYPCLAVPNDAAVDVSESEQDTLVELQDVAGEIASLRGRSHFPLPVSPFSREELKQRLPLIFHFDSAGSRYRDILDGGLSDDGQAQTVLIHQVTTRQSAQHDVGFVTWPSSVVLARWVVSNSTFVAQAPHVLEIGAGCGLVSIAASLIRKRTAGKELSSPGLHEQSSVVTATDFNSVVLQNLERNVALNDVCDYCQVLGLDFNDQTLLGSSSGWVDTEGRLHPPVDLILAADIICQPEDAYGVAFLIRKSLRPGGQAVIVCADSAARFGVDHFVPACQKQGLLVSVTAVEDLCLEQLARNLDLTSGYVPGMTMNTFQVCL